jgi:hypothetical protein
MPLPLPELDDRNFQQLMADALARIKDKAPGWTDRSPGDPGIVLLDLYAYLTEVMIYRLNRLSEKAYIAFLRLLGTILEPPAAAEVTLTFSRGAAGQQPLTIPAGTRVTLERSGPAGEVPVFTTAEEAVIPAGATSATARAFHAALIEREAAGPAMGEAGLQVAVSRPPIAAATAAGLRLVVGVEMAAGEASERSDTFDHEGKTYRVWSEMADFANVQAGAMVYVVDRMAGTITFAPALRRLGDDGQLAELPEALAAVPAKGRQILVSYWSGGGPEGNVAAGTLTVLKDPPRGGQVQVTNTAPAVGGRAAETLDNALVRGPQDLHSLQRAVTASDFEALALKSSAAIARARALTQAAVWSFAAPGTVEVLLVPDLAAAGQDPAQASLSALLERQAPEVRDHVQAELDARRPLGTVCRVNWAHYKPVRVRARIAVDRAEDPNRVRQRVLDRLYGTINPLSTRLSPGGWAFGQALHASHVYDMALKEPGVRWVDQVHLLVDEVPEGPVAALARDFYQRSAGGALRTYYAGSGPTVFRSLNDGDGWEAAGRFGPDVSGTGQADGLRASSEQPGWLAATLLLPNGRSRVYVSADAGETWDLAQELARVYDLAWLPGDAPVLLLGADDGLYKLSIEWGPSFGANLLQQGVDRNRPELGFYAVAVTRIRGSVSVAVAAESQGGIFLSFQGGDSFSFHPITQQLQGEDVRVLEVQTDGPRAFLWAGTAVPGGPSDNGKGCARRELLGAEDSADGWKWYSSGWQGGSCRALAIDGAHLVAGTYRGGVARLNLAEANPAWQTSLADLNCGLPLAGGRGGQANFAPVDAVAMGGGGSLVLAGGPLGIYRSSDGGARFASCSSRDFGDRVTLPDTWLFVSGEHDITVVKDGQ